MSYYVWRLDRDREVSRLGGSGDFDTRRKPTNAWTVKFALALALYLACAAARGIPLVEAVTAKELVCKLTGDGRSQLTVQVENHSDAKQSVEVPAGVVLAGKSGARIAVIREAKLEIEPGQAAEAAVPAVPLSAENTLTPEPYALTAEKATELQPLLDYSAAHNDLPRATAQVTALLLRGDTSYAAWLGFLRMTKARRHGRLPRTSSQPSTAWRWPNSSSQSGSLPSRRMPTFACEPFAIRGAGRRRCSFSR